MTDPNLPHCGDPNCGCPTNAQMDELLKLLGFGGEESNIPIAVTEAQPIVEEADEV